jgi:hypothetical protein
MTWGVADWSKLTFAVRWTGVRWVVEVGGLALHGAGLLHFIWEGLGKRSDVDVVAA